MTYSEMFSNLISVSRTLLATAARSSPVQSIGPKTMSVLLVDSFRDMTSTCYDHNLPMMLVVEAVLTLSSQDMASKSSDILFHNEHILHSL